MRQALGGMLWTKQYFFYDVDRWLQERVVDTHSSDRRGSSRNREWYHMVNDDIISMPDKWEYPWYAAWDLAFHTIALGIVDLDFAKEQLMLLLNEAYLHPNGQIPAYEWNFSDVNPPVHPWATMYIYNMEKELRGKGDNGAGLGASHQTGWTGLVARLIHLYSYLDPEEMLKGKYILTYKEPSGPKR